jgi:deazaflavin-dependent oxidoreductase (nitroreductase family)
VPIGTGWHDRRAMAIPASPTDPRPTARALSRKERVGLWLHRTLDRRLTPLGVWVYRRTRGGVTRPWKVDALLLTTRGRRTGRERTVVLQWFRDGDAMILVGANDGGDAHPAWVHNLRAHPDARVDVMGRTIAVRAQELPPAEAAGQWQAILRRDPSYERYARATSRPFPIIRLAPLPGDRMAASMPGVPPPPASGDLRRLATLVLIVAIGAAIAARFLARRRGRRPR